MRIFLTTLEKNLEDLRDFHFFSKCSFVFVLVLEVNWEFIWFSTCSFGFNPHFMRNFPAKLKEILDLYQKFSKKVSNFQKIKFPISGFLMLFSNWVDCSCEFSLPCCKNIEIFEKLIFSKIFEFFVLNQKMFKFLVNIQISGFLILLSDWMGCSCEFFLPCCKKCWNGWEIDFFSNIFKFWFWTKSFEFSVSLNVKRSYSGRFSVRRKCCEAQLRLYVNIQSFQCL